LIDQRYHIGLADGAHGPGDVPFFAVTMRRLLRGPNLPNWQQEAALASVDAPFDWRGHLVRYVTFSPRYVGHALATILSQGGVVGVARVASHAEPLDWNCLEPSSLDYWGAGVVKLCV
jgi:hypothetical protein